MEDGIIAEATGCPDTYGDRASENVLAVAHLQHH
jgi:hypothetical protein